ncbi:MAG: hypothetical protein HW413_62 [Thermoleophilia bacterium]|nr:hypothetical protein [Thermoleophilia bacterium]
MAGDLSILMPVFNERATEAGKTLTAFAGIHVLRTFVGCLLM